MTEEYDAPGRPLTDGTNVYTSNGNLVYTLKTKHLRSEIQLAYETWNLDLLQDKDARYIIWLLYFNKVFSEEVAWDSKSIKERMTECFPYRVGHLVKAESRHGTFGRGLHYLRRTFTPAYFKCAQPNGNNFVHWLDVSGQLKEEESPSIPETLTPIVPDKLDVCGQPRLRALLVTTLLQKHLAKDCSVSPADLLEILRERELVDDKGQLTKHGEYSARKVADGIGRMPLSLHTLSSELSNLVSWLKKHGE